MKACIVAGLGRHGMPPVSRRLVPLKDAPDGARLVDATPGRMGYCVVEEPDEENSALHHWYDCILMRVRLWQWERRCEEEADGNVVLATDTDALYILYPTERSLDSVALGGVRQRVVSSSRFPYDRALVSAQKIKLPGIPRGSPLRQEYTSGRDAGIVDRPGGAVAGQPGSAAMAYALAIREAHARAREESPRHSALSGFELGWREMEPEGGRRRLGGPRRRPRRSEVE